MGRGNSKSGVLYGKTRPRTGRGLNTAIHQQDFEFFSSGSETAYAIEQVYAKAHQAQEELPVYQNNDLLKVTDYEVIKALTPDAATMVIIKFQIVEGNPEETLNQALAILETWAKKVGCQRVNYPF